MAVRKIEISLVGSSIATRTVQTPNTGVIEYYPISHIKSVTGTFNPTVATSSGGAYPYAVQATITIEFSDISYPSLSFDVQSVTNQATWLPTLAGLNVATLDINGWINSVVSPSGLATEVTLQTVATNTTAVSRTPGMLRPTASGNVNTVAANFYSVSVANVGLANGTVLGGTTIKPGEIFNFSADALNNFFTSFAYDATGTEFIIIYVS